MKNRIRLNESQLHNVIKESVKKVLKESKDNWRGCPNVYMISHGEWSDPELEADGCVANYNRIENDFWYEFLEDSGWDDSDSGNPQCEAEFNNWLQKHESNVISAICDASDNYCDDDSLNEGFIRNVTQGAKSFFGKGDAGKKTSGHIRHNGGLNLRKRINAAKMNYQMTKEGGKINDVIQFLENLVANKQLSPQMTIAELIGGSLNNNKYGRLSAMRDNRTSRASKAMNDIYR